MPPASRSPGLVRYDEVYGAGEITHAFRFSTRATNDYVWPASHRAGSTVNAPPMGTRMRMKASRDISGYPPEIQKIFRAMKRYGLILADNGSDMYITGTMDARWNNDILNPAFHSLRADDFEVVELGWVPGTPPAPPTGLRIWTGRRQKTEDGSSIQRDHRSYRAGPIVVGVQHLFQEQSSGRCGERCGSNSR